MIIPDGETAHDWKLVLMKQGQCLRKWIAGADRWSGPILQMPTAFFPDLKASAKEVFIGAGTEQGLVAGHGRR